MAHGDRHRDYTPGDLNGCYPTWCTSAAQRALFDCAKDASLRAAQNATVAPQLLFAPIIAALRDHFPFPPEEP